MLHRYAELKGQGKRRLTSGKTSYFSRQTASYTSKSAFALLPITHKTVIALWIKSEDRGIPASEENSGNSGQICKMSLL